MYLHLWWIVSSNLWRSDKRWAGMGHGQWWGGAHCRPAQTVRKWCSAPPVDKRTACERTVQWKLKDAEICILKKSKMPLQGAKCIVDSLLLKKKH